MILLLIFLSIFSTRTSCANTYSLEGVTDSFRQMLLNKDAPLVEGCDLATRITQEYIQSKTAHTLQQLTALDQLHNSGISWRGLESYRFNSGYDFNTLMFMKEHVFNVAKGSLGINPQPAKEAERAIIARELLNLGRLYASQGLLPTKLLELKEQFDKARYPFEKQHLQMTALFMLFGVGDQFDWFQWYGQVPDKAAAAMMINKYAANTDFLPESKQLRSLRGYHDKDEPLAVAPSEERKLSTTDMTPQQFFTLIQQFREFHLRQECERLNQHHIHSISFIHSIYSGEAVEAELAKKEKYFRNQINWRLSPESTYFNPVHYPMSVLDFGLEKAKTCFRQLYMTTPFSEAEAALADYGVVPLRGFDAARTNLVLGCGNYPTDLSFVSRSKKHYGRDYHYDADTVDISAAMNPTIVGSSHESGVYDYIHSQGKMYDAIVAEASPFITVSSLNNIRKILKMNGTYCSGASCIFIEIIPSSLKDSVPLDEDNISIFVDDAEFESLKALTEEEAQTRIFPKLEEFFKENGFSLKTEAKIEASVLQEKINYYLTTEIFTITRIR